MIQVQHGTVLPAAYGTENLQVYLVSKYEVSVLLRFNAYLSESD